MKVQSLRVKVLLIKAESLTFKNHLNPGISVKVSTFLDHPSSTRQLVLCIRKKRFLLYGNGFFYLKTSYLRKKQIIIYVNHLIILHKKNNK